MRRTTWRKFVLQQQFSVLGNVARNASEQVKLGPSVGLSSAQSVTRPRNTPCLTSRGHDDVRQHAAQRRAQGGVPGPQDLDAAAHPAHGQWVSRVLLYKSKISHGTKTFVEYPKKTKKRFPNQIIGQSSLTLQCLNSVVMPRNSICQSAN